MQFSEVRVLINEIFISINFEKELFRGVIQIENNEKIRMDELIMNCRCNTKNAGVRK